MPKYKVNYDLGYSKTEWFNDYEKAKELCLLYRDTDAFMLWEEQDDDYHLLCGYWRDGEWRVEETYG